MVFNSCSPWLTIDNISGITSEINCYLPGGVVTKVVKIDYARREDVPAVLEIERSTHAALGRPRRALDEARLLEFVEQRRTRFEVMKTGEGKVVGFLLFDGSEPETAVVTRLTVHPDHRRAGCGRSLMGRADHWARLAKAEKLEIHVYEEDEAAIKFFQSRGLQSRLTRGKFEDGDAVTFSLEVEKRT